MKIFLERQERLFSSCVYFTDNPWRFTDQGIGIGESIVNIRKNTIDFSTDVNCLIVFGQSPK